MATATAPLPDDLEMNAYRDMLRKEEEEKRRAMTHTAPAPMPPSPAAKAAPVTGAAALLDAPVVRRPMPSAAPPAPTSDATTAASSIAPPEPATPPISDPVVKSSKTQGGSTSYKVQTEAEKKNLVDIDKANADAIAAEKRAGVLAGQKAIAEEMIADKVAAQQAEREKRLKETTDFYQKELAAKEAKVEEEFERYRSMKPTDFWADKGTGRKVVASLAIALGAFANRGGRNDALEIVNGAIERDAKQKADAVAKQRDVLEMSKGRVVDMRARKAERLRDIELEAAAKYESLAAYGKSLLAKTGMDEAAIESDKNIAALTAKAAEKKQSVLEGLRKEVGANWTKTVAEMDARAVPFGAAKPATEGQSNANSRLTIMLHEAKNIESLPPLSPAARAVLFEELALKNAAEKNPAMDFTARLTGIRKTVEQQLRNDNDRRVYASYLSFLDPLVRQRTGANAPPSEVASLAAPIMPAKGDKENDLTEKRTRRRVILESIAEQSNDPAGWRQRIGGVYGGGQAPVQGAPAAAPAGDGWQRRRAANGKTIEYRKTAKGIEWREVPGG